MEQTFVRFVSSSKIFSGSRAFGVRAAASSANRMSDSSGVCCFQLTSVKCSHSLFTLMTDPFHAVSICCLVGVSCRVFGSANLIGDWKFTAAQSAAGAAFFGDARLGGIASQKAAPLCGGRC